jgi:hypothetical protein
MTEAFNQEVEKGTHLGHAMPTLRIDRGDGQGLGKMAFDQQWLEATLTDRVSHTQISEPHNSTASCREPDGGFTTVD